jgi:integrase
VHFSNAHRSSMCYNAHASERRAQCSQSSQCQVRRPPSHVQGASLKDGGASLRAFPNAGLLTPRKGNAVAKVRKRIWQTMTGERIAWVADYFAPGLDGEKRRCTKSFSTKKEASAWLAHTVVEIKQGVHTPAHRSPTVAVAGEAWITQAETDGLERATVRQYRQHLDLHIKPFLGHHKLCDLTPGTITSFRNVLIKQKRSRALVGKVVSSLGSILAEAMANGQLARNVVAEQARHDRRRARVEKRHKKQLQVGVDIPTNDEIRAMLEHADRLRPLLVTAIFTGLRASELRGLTWDAVDLERKVLTVRQRADRWNQLGSPKSDSGKREVPLAPIVVNTPLRVAVDLSPICGRRRAAALACVPQCRRPGRTPCQHAHARLRARAIRRRHLDRPEAPEIRLALTPARGGKPVHRAGL